MINLLLSLAERERLYPEEAESVLVAVFLNDRLFNLGPYSLTTCGRFDYVYVNQNGGIGQPEAELTTTSFTPFFICYYKACSVGSGLRDG